MKFSVTKTTTPKAKPDAATLGFGKYFSDHMLIIDYHTGKGWYDPRIVPYAPISLDPAAMVLHYAQEVFEGMKAYPTADGGVQLFRPLENIRRLNRSCERLCIAPIDEQLALDAIKALIELDADWVPRAEGTSLYIRPFIIATDAHIGVRASDHYQFMVILSPVGAYYPEGINPVKIVLESEDVRAVRGGTGQAKAGGNYAATIRAQSRAQAKGYTQVLWLDGVERKYIEEVGTMNIFFVIGDEVVTPALNGSILPGITRDSAIQLLRKWGYTVNERDFSIDELFAAQRAGTLSESFGTGTAAVISPVGLFHHADTDYVVGDGNIGALAARLHEALTGIQWGRLPDDMGWTDKI